MCLGMCTGSGSLGILSLCCVHGVGSAFAGNACGAFVTGVCSARMLRVYVCPACCLCSVNVRGEFGRVCVSVCCDDVTLEGVSVECLTWSWAVCTCVKRSRKLGACCSRELWPCVSRTVFEGLCEGRVHAWAWRVLFQVCCVCGWGTVCVRGWHGGRWDSPTLHRGGVLASTLPSPGCVP